MQLPSRPEFRWPVRVYYEDTDAGGVVYHSIYLNFMERARTEWLRALGFEQDQLRREQQVIFAVRQAVIDYLLPAHFNESLEIIVTLDKLGGASLTLQQAVMRDNTELCRGTIKIACLNSETMRPRSLPRALLMELENAC